MVCWLLQLDGLEHPSKEHKWKYRVVDKLLDFFSTTRGLNTYVVHLSFHSDRCNAGVNAVYWQQITCFHVPIKAKQHTVIKIDMTNIQNFVTNSKTDQSNKLNTNYYCQLKTHSVKTFYIPKYFFKATFFKLSVYRPP